MREKMKIYGDEILDLVEKIESICAKSGIPVVMAFCLDLVEKGDGKMQMTIAGVTNLQDTVSPDPMILAANIMQVPGFKFAESELMVH